jgi:hypothetical protein
MIYNFIAMVSFESLTIQRETKGKEARKGGWISKGG